MFFGYAFLNFAMLFFNFNLRHVYAFHLIKKIMMFLSKASKIGDNKFDLLCLTFVFLSANGVLSLFVNVTGVAVDEEFMIIILG
jgi:hypothetical protein